MRSPHCGLGREEERTLYKIGHIDSSFCGLSIRPGTGFWQGPVSNWSPSVLWQHWLSKAQIFLHRSVNSCPSGSSSFPPPRQDPLASLLGSSDLPHPPETKELTPAIARGLGSILIGQRFCHIGCKSVEDYPWIGATLSLIFLPARGQAMACWPPVS